MKVKIDQLKLHSDKRGIVFEPIDGESLLAQKNCHVVVSKPGVVRGNHYHLNGTEMIAVVGPAFLIFKEGDDLHEVRVPADQTYRFVIPPRISHAIKNTGDKINILVAFNTLPHDPQNPDTVADILVDD